MFDAVSAGHICLDMTPVFFKESGGIKDIFIGGKLTNIGEMIGLQGVLVMILGIIIGIVGIVLVCMAYPTYSAILKKEREKIAPEIIRLTDELMK